MGAYTRAPAGRAAGSPWATVLAWTAAIVVLSCIPAGRFAELGAHGLDRVFHAAAYAVLGVLVARAVASDGHHETAVAAATLVGTVALGALMEWVQGFVGRDPDVLDWVADGTGVIAALAVRAAWIGVRERAS